jgi:hypothetical protein
MKVEGKLEEESKTVPDPKGKLRKRLT